MDTSVLKSIADIVSFSVQFDAQDKIDLQTDEKLNQFDGENIDGGAAASRGAVGGASEAPIPNVSEEEGEEKNEMDFSFVRPKKQKKVCIVEEDIKMTKDEIEIYNQMRDEAVQENQESERQANALF